MPELPEVETVRRGLARRLTGQRISAVRLSRPDLRFPIPNGLAFALEGRSVQSVDRRAKYILLRLAPGTGDAPVMIMHLGMSGRVLFDEGGREAQPHDHLVIETVEGTRVIYNDARRFGFVLLSDAESLEAHPRLAGLGPEPLEEGFNPAYLRGRLAGKLTSIKVALLDQKLVAGVGNIYACEALFQAGIAPTRLAATITAGQAKKLVAAVKDVLGRAIEAGGSSLRDYVQTDGELGYFQHAWAVYGKEGQPCPSCPGGRACRAGIARIVQSGRSSFYCIRRQR